MTVSPGLGEVFDLCPDQPVIDQGRLELKRLERGKSHLPPQEAASAATGVAPFSPNKELEEAPVSVKRPGGRARTKAGMGP